MSNRFLSSQLFAERRVLAMALPLNPLRGSDGFVPTSDRSGHCSASEIPGILYEQSAIALNSRQTLSCPS